MSSIEFQLAYLTAQTSGCKPDRVQGDVPEFTKAFIAQAASQVTPLMVYHSIMAYYCDDECSIDALNLKMADWCWCRLKTHFADRSYRALDIARVAELAVLFYLNPLVEVARSVQGCAAWVRVSTGVWESKYSKQRDVVIHELACMKSDGEVQMRRILRDDEDIANTG